MYESAEESVLDDCALSGPPKPPAIRTLPSWIIVAVGHIRRAVIAPVGLNDPAMGSYTSSTELDDPPTTNTLPSGRIAEAAISYLIQ